MRDFRPWHTAFGGAGEINLQALGQFGPAGLIMAGTQFEREDRYLLRESFELLEHALILLKRDDYYAWLALYEPYLADPSDPSIVDDWRLKSKHSIRAQRSLQNHDRGVWALTEMMLDQDLYCVTPSRMTTTQEKQVEKRNDELYSLFLKLRKDGESKTRAVKQAAEWCGYGLTRAWEIVGLRSNDKEKVAA